MNNAAASEVTPAENLATTPSTVFMFPGQSSRYPEMIGKLLSLRPANGARIDEASSILGRDLRAQYAADHDGIYARNRDVQVGVFLANHLFMETLASEGVTATHSLGLSLGEYNHLVHIGALSFEAALRVVDLRGEAYDHGPDGKMVSVFPIEIEVLDEVVARVRDRGCVEIGNYNSPTQHVLSGEREAVDAVLAILEDECFIEGVEIEPNIPMHSTRFRPVADVLRDALENAPWQPPRLPYLPNVTGRFETDPVPARFVDLLLRHVFSPVRWRESIDMLVDRMPGASFIEVGPRSVLYNLLAPRWHKVDRHRSDSAEGLPEAFAATVRKLRHVV